MATTWYVIAHRAGARIVERQPDVELRLFEDIPHDRGRLKSGQIDTDAPGSAHESGRAGVHGMTKSQSAHERDGQQFARDLARGLAAARNDGSFDHLVLVAEPRFLGLLRGALDAQTAARVSETVPHDLAQVPLHELPERLGLPPRPRYT